MTDETIRDRLHDGATVVGPLQILDSPMVSEAVGLAGADIVVFDQEHGPLTAETSLAMAAAAQQGGAAPIVRVRTNDPAEIQRALDIGTAGVQVPQVETRADAERARDAARFAPLGDRGLSKYVRAGGYRTSGSLWSSRSKASAASRTSRKSSRSTGSTVCFWAPTTCRRPWASPAKSATSA